MMNRAAIVRRNRRNVFRTELRFESLEARRVFTCSPSPTGGPDYIVCDGSSDLINAGAGDDSLFLNGGDDNGNGGPGRDKVYGGPGNDIVVAGGADDDFIVMGDEGDDLVYGGKGNDGDKAFVAIYFVNGGMGNDRVFGGDGNDVVRGGQGNDLVYGDDDPAGVQLSPVATGNDWIAGDLGNDQLWGQGGADMFYFGIEAGSSDTINDWTPSQGDRIDLTMFDAQPGAALATGVITDFGSLLMTQNGSDSVITLPTNQFIVLKNTAVTSIQPSHFIGKASIDHRGNDNLVANPAGEQLNGREGDDTITGGVGDDNLNGNTGRDKVYGGPGNDRVGGGADDDYVVMGDEGDDWVYGGRGNDGDMTFANPAYFVNGGMGNDRVFGGDGNDVVRGGQGDDRVYGDDDPSGVQLSPVATGNDWIAGDLGNDQLWGLGGADTFYFGFDTSGIVDTINDWTPSQGDRIDLSALDAQPGNAFATGVITDFGSLAIIQIGGNTEITLPTGQKIVLINTVVASLQPQHFVGKASIDRRGNDVLVANPLGEQLNGREGDDQITGSPAADNINGNRGLDTVDGGLGNDVVRGGKDDDFVSGGDGDDTVYGDLGNDNINGNKGRDFVYGGPGNDIVGGGMDDDYGVYGEDGDDKVYGGEGNDADINGNMGNDEVYGGDGNDVVRGGKGDDYVSGDGGDDMLYGGYGVNVLVGGTGKDTFVLDRAFDVQNTIVDFERGQDRIDVTALSELVTYEQLVLVQQGANTVVHFAPTNKLIIQGQTPSQIKSTDFIGQWSANKAIHLWVPGLLHDRITQDFAAQGGANATTPTGDPVIKINEYRINGFNPLANPGNGAPHKPFQLIDLRSVSVGTVVWRQEGSDTVVDLDSRFGKVLRLVGVTASQVTPANFLTVGQDEQGTINAYLADWIDQSQVQRTAIPPADRFFHEGNRVVYEASPTVISLVNKRIIHTNPNAMVVRFDPLGSKIQVVDGFNPSNPLHSIDLTDLGVPSLSFVGIEQLGPDTKLNFPGGKSLILKNVAATGLPESSIIGWAAPSRYEVFLPNTESPVVTISGFNPNLPNQLIDLSGYMATPDFTEIEMSGSSGATTLTFKNSSRKVVIANVSPNQLTPEHIIGREASNPGPTVAAATQTMTFSSLGAEVPLNSGEKVFLSYGGHFAGDSGGGTFTTYSLPVVKTPLDYDPTGKFNEFLLGVTQSAHDYLNSQKDGMSNADALGYFQSLTDAYLDFEDSRDFTLSNTIGTYSKFLKSTEDIARKGAGWIAKFASYDENLTRLTNAFRAAGLPDSFAKREARVGAAFQTLGSSVAEGSGKLAGLAVGRGKSWAGAIGGLATEAVYNAFAAGPIDEFFVSKGVEKYAKHVDFYSNDQSYSEVFLFEEATIEEQELLSKLPAGGKTYIGEYALQKDVIDDQVLFTRWRTNDATTTRGDLNGVDPNVIEDFSPDEIALITSTEGLEGVVGAIVYANGRFYKRMESGFAAVANAAEDLLAIAEGRFKYRDVSGAANTVLATFKNLDFESIVSGSIGDWYHSLLNEHTAGNKTVPSGLASSASQATGAFLADIVLNGDISSALKRAKDTAIRSQMAQVQEKLEARVLGALGGSELSAASVIKKYFGDEQLVGNFAIDLAKTIGIQLVMGEFDDSFASSVVTQLGIQYGVGHAISYATTELGTGMTFALSKGLDIGGSFIVPSFDPISIAANIIITTLLNRYFSEEIAAVSTFIGDVGERVWDFIRDPVNSIKNIFDDPKFRSVDGTSGFDTLFQSSNARIQSDLKAGNDVMFGGDGWGIVLGGQGDDIILHGNTITGGGVPGNGVGELYGEEGNDYINAGGGNDELHGGAGADVLYGGTGNDYLWGGDTQRTYSRNTGADVSDYLDGGLGNDFYTGNAGRDTFVVTREPGAIDTFLDFRPGEDWIDLSQFPTTNDFGDIQIAIENGKTILVLPNSQRVVIEYVARTALLRGDFIFTQYGTSGSDVLLGSDSVEVFNGLEGSDDLRLGGGNDVANGNQGDDQISGAAGNDQLHGGHGNDAVSGGEGNDVMWGGLGNDSLKGNQGNDRVDGGAGNDEVRGGKDDDQVSGGEGDDQIYGDLGNDVVVGGPGADDFYLTPDQGSTDYIQDFSLSQGDAIILAGFASSPIAAKDVIQVGYDTYIFFPNNQRSIIRFADATAIRNSLGLEPDLDTPKDQLAPAIHGVSSSLVINRTVMLRPAQGAYIADPDSPDLSGGNFVANIQTGSGSLVIQPQSGSAIGAEGNRVSWNGFDIGYFQSAADGKSLTIEFGANAVPLAIDAVIREIAVANFQGGTISFLVTDGDGGTSDLVTTLLAINDAPTDVVLSNASVVENSPLDTVVGTLNTVDPNSANTFTYSFVSGPGSEQNANFRIDNNGTVSTRASLDFESQAVHSIRIRATDQGGLFFEKVMSITIVNVTELTQPVQIGDGSAQRSIIRQLVLNFDNAISAETGAFIVQQRRTDAGVVSFHDVATQAVLTSTAGGGTRVTLTFSGNLTNGFGALADGNYQLTVVGAKVTAIDSQLAFDGNGDGVAGGDLVVGAQLADNFFALFGDTNGDGTVGVAEFGQFRSAFGKNSSQAGYDALFDYDGDGIISVSDFGQFRTRFGKFRMPF